jgi:hypothetical protein
VKGGGVVSVVEFVVVLVVGGGSDGVVETETHVRASPPESPFPTSNNPSSSYPHRPNPTWCSRYATKAEETSWI